MKKATTTMKKTKSGSKEGQGGDSPSQLIDARIKELSDWRGKTFNSSLEGNTRRAIDFHEGDKIDEKALKALIRAASLNTDR
jgi:hypothetical protein